MIVYVNKLSFDSEDNNKYIGGYLNAEGFKTD